MDDQIPPPLTAPPPDRTYREAEPRPTAPQPQPQPQHAEPPPFVPVRRRRSGLWLLLILLAVAGLVAWVVLRGGHEAAPTRRFQTTGPMPVGTAKVAKGDMPVLLTALGTVTPLATVTVQSQINGQLMEVGFQEGQMVKKGDFLAQIDPRPYQVALEQAEAQFAKDQAALKNAQVDLARYKTLVAQNSIARQTLDTQAATVQQDAATLQVDQAQIDTQKLNLAYCRVVAPLSGRVGLRQIDPGNYVQTSSATGLVVITQLQPISVIFTLPEDSLAAVLRQVHGGAKLQVTAYDRTGTTKLDTGTLETVDNQIDTTTGTVKLRAVFNNPDMILFPNQFVNVQLLVNTLHDADLVPTAAIQRGEPGTFVYLVKPDETVSVQPVTLGPSDNQNVAVTKGLLPGQLVVTDGADRLKAGAKIKIAENTAANGAAPAPGAAPAQSVPASPAAVQEQPQGQKRRGRNGQNQQRSGG